MTDSAQTRLTVEELIQRLDDAVEDTDQRSWEKVVEVLKLDYTPSGGDWQRYKEAKIILCLKAIRLQSLALLELLFSIQYVVLGEKLDLKRNQEFISSAIQNNFIEGIKFLLEHGFILESKLNDQEWIALFQAVEYGKPLVVNFLLKEQPKHVHSTLQGLTLVELARKTHNLDIVMATCLNVPYQVQYFIDNGADLTSCDSNKNTALHYLCQNPETKDSLDCIKRFVETAQGLHILDSKNVEKKTPLYIALTSGNEHVVDILVEAGCDVNDKCTEHDDTTLYSAINMKATWNSTSDIVVKLITAGSKVNASDKYGTTPLMQAASVKDLDSIKYLLQKGADLHSEDCVGNGIVDYCFDYKNFEGYKNILEKDVLEFFHIAGARFRIEDIVVKYVGDILANDDGDTLEYLVSNGLDIHHIGKNNCNILHLISKEKTTRIYEIKPFCDEADINHQDIDGDTPLMYAAKYRRFPFLINYFLERGADVNLRNNIGQTPLMIVAIENEVETLQKLIDAGADVNIRAQDGRTALQFLVRCYRFISSPYVDCLLILLANGGSRSLDYKDEYGVTPFQNVLETRCVSFNRYLITQNCSFGLVSDRGERFHFFYEYYHHLLKLAKLFYYGGAPKQLILDIFKMDDADEKKFRFFCENLRLTELCRRQIRISIGPGIEEKLEILKIAPILIRYICLRDLIHSKNFDINNITFKEPSDCDDPSILFESW